MTLPDGISTATLTADAMSFGGVGASVTLTVTPVLGGNAEAVTWSATGQGLFNTAFSNTADAPDQARVTVPHVDQDGVIDGKGNDFKNWSYTCLIDAKWPSGERKRIVKAVQPQQGQDIIDLNMVPDGSVTSPTSAPIPAVTSVNGQTGAVEVEGATNATVAGFITDDGATKTALNDAIAQGIADDATVAQAAADAAATAIANADLITSDEQGSTIGSAAYDADTDVLTVTVSTPWGIRTDGTAYHDTDGAASDEAAILTINPLSGAPRLTTIGA